MIGWEWRKDPKVFSLFAELLLRATHKSSKYRGYNLSPGDVIYGHKAYAEHIGVSVQSIRTSLNKLKSTGELTIKTTNKFSIISITNWNQYQGDQQADQQATNKQLTINQQATNTIQEGKKVKKVKKGSRIPSDWTPNEDNLQYATKQGFQNGAIQKIAEDFKDYWIASSGQKAVKQDWDAAWRMWVRNQIKFNGEPEKKGDLF